MSGIGKTTAIDKWNGRTLLNDKWRIHAKFLDYNELRNTYCEFIDKHGKPLIELAYSLTHLLRTVSQNNRGNANPEVDNLLLVDRSCISNLVYFLLFFLKCENDYDKLYKIFSQYDDNHEDLPVEVYRTIRDVETAVKIIGKEFVRLHYHVIIITPNNPFVVLDNIMKRGNFDAAFATVDYIRSQAFLFQRFADLLDKSISSVMRVDDFFILDEHQLKNHLQSNAPFY